ncbi:acyltransferase [Amylibacter sp. SFDW26]|uniref:acyltransferase family protein n=1 Tax=Amylibacter sp. SFDW26 TaxID=2652722 RepID=UPI0012619CD0|nr:acyltransferase [Amylibacter sp. SFDW26]KAB7614734.1 acyltransferase [Amylibacter sp. SFDW26]
MIWIDCLRLIASVSMVGLHASSDINGQPFSAFEVWDRTGPVIFRSIMYLARTELFLIISLFLLFMSLDLRPRNYGHVITEQAKRLMRPFLFWVVVYAFYRLMKAYAFGYEAEIWAQLFDPMRWLGYVVLGDVQYHMHFLPTLFAMILLFPICLIAVDAPWVGIIVLMCLFAKREADVWLWAHKDVVPAFDYIVRLVKVVTYMGYGFIAASAYGLYKTIGRHGLFRYFGAMLFVGSLLYIIKLVYSFRVIEFSNWQYNYEPAFWADFLMPCILFFSFMASAKIEYFTKLSQLAPYGFGIYLIHPIFLDIAEVILWNLALNPMAFIIIKVFWAVVLSFISVWLLSKTVMFGWVVGLGQFPEISQISNILNFKGNQKPPRNE